MATEENEAHLTNAVKELTDVAKGLDKLLRDEYPRRSEVERRFVSKMQSQRNITKMVILAIITVVSCYVISVGAYSVCFVGDLDNPTFCHWVPGYNERVDRSREVDKIHREQDLRIARLEHKLGIKEPIGGKEEN